MNAGDGGRERKKKKERKKDRHRQADRQEIGKKGRKEGTEWNE